jgi:hypothetical protein
MLELSFFSKKLSSIRVTFLDTSKRIMSSMRSSLYVIAVIAFFPVQASTTDPINSDALIVLTTAGYLSGAADACKVDSIQSNELNNSISIAISHGQYGDATQANILLNNARQRGIADTEAKKIDCTKIGDSINANLG